MNTQLSKTHKITTFIILSLFFSFSRAALLPQSEENAPKEAKESTELKIEQPKDDVEVIDVVGERSLLFFRDEMQKAELDFYEAFNALADKEKYKVKCRREKRSASNISIKVCHPQFVLDRMAQETQAALQTGAPFPKWEDVEFSVREEQAESIAYVERVVTKNPQLLTKLIALNERQTKYEQQKSKEE